MENIKEALQYAVDLSNNEQKIISDIEGNEYYDSNKHDIKPLIPNKFYPEPLNLSTLTSLINYYKNDINKIKSMRTMVSIESPTEIRVYTENDERQKRSTLIVVKADLPKFFYGSFMDQELFNINLQSKFKNDENRALLISFASSISIENGAEITDDGVAQITTIKNGVASKSKAIAPNPISLAPFRTFHEVNQPTSEFIFRLNKSAEMALFEADGGAWRNIAVSSIKEYLVENLRFVNNAIVLA